MYVITDVRQGFGESPSFADDAYVTYKGMFLDGYSFDSNDQPTWFSGLSTVRGFYELLPHIERSTWKVEANGNVTFDGFGTQEYVVPKGVHRRPVQDPGLTLSRSPTSRRKWASILPQQVFQRDLVDV